MVWLDPILTRRSSAVLTPNQQIFLLRQHLPERFTRCELTAAINYAWPARIDTEAVEMSAAAIDDWLERGAITPDGATADGLPAYRRTA